MSNEQLKKNKIKMLAVWNRGSKIIKDLHAVYVDEYSPRRSKPFLTINSWGNKNQPYPELEIKDEDGIVELYYISIYLDSSPVSSSSSSTPSSSATSQLQQLSISIPPQLFLSTTGDSGEYHGNYLGLYKHAGDHNNRPYYRQHHTVDDGETGYVLYYNKEGHIIVAEKLDGYAELKNESGDMFSNKWKYSELKLFGSKVS